MKNIKLYNLVTILLFAIACNKSVENEFLGKNQSGTNIIQGSDNANGIIPPPVDPGDGGGDPPPPPVIPVCGLHPYDVNQNYKIEGTEVTQALNDYYLKVIPINELFEVIYLSQGKGYKCETNSNGDDVLVFEPKDPNVCQAHYLDTNADFKFSSKELKLALKLYSNKLISLKELFRVIFLANPRGYKCDDTTVDGYNINPPPPPPAPVCKAFKYDFNANFKIEKIELDRARADYNANQITLSQLLRVIQFYNSAGYKCEAGTEDGYKPIPKPIPPPPPPAPVCKAFKYDFDANFKIEQIELDRARADYNGNALSLSELLRVIQFYNSAGYKCEAGTEDGYKPIPKP